MKTILRFFLLYPLSLLFGLITSLRNFLFDKRVLKSKTVDLPTICVGNLAVGGTGKTPHTEYILSLFQSEKKIAMLSRGYKRITKGFQLADENSNAKTIGDEAFQIHQKFTNLIVAVCESRLKGIKELLKVSPNLELVVLDDAFQHRQIQVGFSILLTDYARLYSSDHYLPFGRLRESKRGSRRADIIIVSKCPENLTASEMNAIKIKLNPEAKQEVFFSNYQYEDLRAVFPSENKPQSAKKIEKDSGVLLVAGIVAPQKIADYLAHFADEIETLFFSDHHQFTKKDFVLLKEKFASLKTKKKIIIVTEKDAARLLSDSNFPDDLKNSTFALPITVKIMEDKEDLLTQKIKNYVSQNSRDSSVS